MSAGAICIFAKAPQPGRTKTRLARDIGDAAAARLAEAFLLDTWHKAVELAATSGARVVLVLDGDPDTISPLVSAAQVVAQGTGDLGARLERALMRELEAAPWAVAIGTDSPTLPVRLIARACERLAGGAAAVLGPCDDGGFYLLGLRQCPRGMLANLPWSSRDTCAATARRLEEQRFDVERLDAWYDVDEASDLERLRAELAAGAIAPETRRALRALDLELSVILPVLDEQARIGQRLRELEPLAERGRAEIIVVDGGSRDATFNIAETFSFARTIRAARGRAAQMNAGARLASADVLLFLHADVTLPADALDWVRLALADPATVAGAFRTWTVADDGRTAPWLHLADVRSRYARLPYGDQALFVRRDVFFEVGGFPNQPLMEDLELGLRLSKRGRIRVVPARVRVSGRRFLAHPLRDTLLVNVFPLLYRLGVDARSLAKLYHNVR